MTSVHADADTAVRTGDDRYVVLPFYLLADVSSRRRPT